MNAPDDILTLKVVPSPWTDSGMSLGRLGRALEIEGKELLSDIQRQLRGVADLPADVYRTVVQVPNESGLRDYFAGAGRPALAALVPISRVLTTHSELHPHGPLLQPVLLGKVFGAQDYITDRKAALAGLPKAMLDDSERAANFLDAHPDLIEVATRAMPSRQALLHLGRLEFWQAAGEEEWEILRARVDAHYEAIVESPERRRRDLPIFRAAYALAYHALAHLDPVRTALAAHAPPALKAYQTWCTYQAQLTRVAERLRQAHPDLPSLNALACEAPDPDHEPSPALGLVPSRPQPPASQLSLPAALGQARVSQVDLHTEQMRTGPMPPAGPRSAPRASSLQLENPGLGPAPTLAAVSPPPGARAQPMPRTSDLPVATPPPPRRALPPTPPLRAGRAPAKASLQSGSGRPPVNAGLPSLAAPSKASLPSVMHSAELGDTQAPWLKTPKRN